MGFENLITRLKNTVDKGLGSITPDKKTDDEEDNMDPVFHEVKEKEKWLDKGPDDFKREEGEKKKLEETRNKLREIPK